MNTAEIIDIIITGTGDRTYVLCNIEFRIGTNYFVFDFPVSKSLVPDGAVTSDMIKKIQSKVGERLSSIVFASWKKAQNLT